LIYPEEFPVLKRSLFVLLMVATQPALASEKGGSISYGINSYTIGGKKDPTLQIEWSTVFTATNSSPLCQFKRSPKEAIFKAVSPAGASEISVEIKSKENDFCKYKTSYTTFVVLDPSDRKTVSPSVWLNDAEPAANGLRPIECVQFEKSQEYACSPLAHHIDQLNEQRASEYNFDFTIRNKRFPKSVPPVGAVIMGESGFRIFELLSMDKHDFAPILFGTRVIGRQFDGVLKCEQQIKADPSNATAEKVMVNSCTMDVDGKVVDLRYTSDAAVTALQAIKPGTAPWSAQAGYHFEESTDAGATTWLTDVK
jgi:hypothetical protein